MGWLLAADPAIRWQVLRDLVGASPREIEAERARVALEGWGARLLEAQDVDGRWAGALYSPKWTSTTYTLLLLHWLGLPAGHQQALSGCRQLWDGASYYDGGINLAKTIHQPETCITAMLILLASSFGFEDDRLEPAVHWLVGQQLDDGGWNCESIRSGSAHGSFHTSISALDALSQYQLVHQQRAQHQPGGGQLAVAEAMARGRDFFLDHQLYRSHRTGQSANAAFLRCPFPPQWHFDVLRGLEHFRAAGTARDERLAAAVEVVRGARRKDGTWPVHQSYPGKVWFRMESAGPGRWATLRALRVLQWWDGAGV
jgi:hypothetical protein